MNFKILKAIRAYSLIQKPLNMKFFIFSIAIAFFSFFVLEKASTQDLLAYLSKPIAEDSRVHENTYLQPDEIGCDGSANLILLLKELEDPVTGAQFKKSIESLPPGQGVRAWLALKDTPLSSSAYWLGRINRWQEAGLKFEFAYSMSDDAVQVLKNGVVVAEISRTAFKVKFNGFGGDIVCPPNRTVTVIGLYHPNEPFMGVWYLSKDLELHKLKMIAEGDLTQGNLRELVKNPGGINLLAVSNDFYNWDLNRDWLYEAAIVRGDIIRIVSDPSLPRTKWKNGIPPGQPGHIGQTRTQDEIDFLESYGFIYDPTIPGYRRP